MERWVERDFLFSPASCVEIPRPLILLEPGRGVKVGQVIGLWTCILAFDSDDDAASPPSAPPILCFSRNPRLKDIPTLANDLQKVYQERCLTEGRKLGISSVQTERKDESSCSTAPRPVSYQSCSSCSGPAITLVDDDNDQNMIEIEEFVKKKKRAPTEHVASIALTDLVKYFNLPITKACRNLNIGLTVLKRKCREFGIPRWPHRKIKSLDTLIQNLQEEVGRQESENQAAAVKAATRRQRMLETEKEDIERRPSTELQKETKRFRQDVFKRRHMAKVQINRSRQQSAEDH